MKFSLEDIELVTTYPQGSTHVAASCVLVANGTKRKLTTSGKYTAEQVRGGINPEEAVASKLGKVAYVKAKELSAE